MSSFICNVFNILRDLKKSLISKFKPSHTFDLYMPILLANETCNHLGSHSAEKLINA